jgi:hypothetical protein
LEIANARLQITADAASCAGHVSPKMTLPNS